MRDGEMIYTVDIPNHNSEDWDEVATFDSEDEAIEFARQRFGADDQGRIGLVTGPHNLDAP